MRCFWLLAAGLVACGGETEETTPIGETPVACQPGERAREDGSCQPAGVPSDMACPPGEVVLDGGGCRAAGVDGCAPGFELASDGGCAAILPAAPCSDGELALPGETSCRPVAPCGNGTWGDIAATEFVDASFSGTSTGSTSAPWKTIGEALAAAAGGDTIAVAAGTYLEDLVITKSVTIWGRCPAMVEVAGQGGDIAAFFVRNGASGAVLRGMAVSGTDIGIVVSGASDVVLQELWIHDTGFRGLDVEGSLGPTSVTVRDSLIERAVGEGIFQGGATLTVERSVVRNNLPEPDGTVGRGIGAQVLNGERATLAVSDCIVEGNHEVGITVIGSDGVIEDTLLRDNQPMPADGTAGWGLWLNHDGLAMPMQRSSTTVRGCVLERNHDGGIALVGSDATVESTTVRSTLSAPGAPYSGMGVVARNKYTTGDRAVLALRSSVIADSKGVGLYVLGADASADGLVVRDTQPAGEPELGGRAVTIEADPLSGQASTLAMNGSVIADNVEHGILVNSSDAVIDATVIRDVRPDQETGKYGRGLNVQLDVMFAHLPATATLRRSLIERTHEAGVAVLAANAIIEASTIREILPRPLDELGGRAVIVQHGPGTSIGASIDISLLLVEDAVDVGVHVVNGWAAIDASVVRGTKARPDGLFGDGISALELGMPTEIRLTNSRVETSARAGVSNFSSLVTLANVLFDCNTLPLAVQQTSAAEPRFDDAGGNVCACGDQDVGCKASGAIEPPAPLE